LEEQRTALSELVERIDFNPVSGSAQVEGRRLSGRDVLQLIKHDVHCAQEHAGRQRFCAV
jgi:hypothetical protein